MSAETVPGAALRASDAERERAVDDLRAHAAEGRLSPEELGERVGRAYAARERSELQALLADLPARRDAGERRPASADGFAGHLRVYLAVMVLLVGIWAASGGGYFWPVWPMLGWGVGLAVHAACRPRAR